MSRVWIRVNSECLAELLYGSGKYIENYATRPYIVKYAPIVSRKVLESFIIQNGLLTSDSSDKPKGLIFGLVKYKSKPFNTYSKYCEAVSKVKNYDLFVYNKDEFVLEVELNERTRYVMMRYSDFINAVNRIDHLGDVVDYKEFDNLIYEMKFGVGKGHIITAIPEINIDDICGIHPPCGWYNTFENGKLETKFEINNEKLDYIKECRTRLIERKLNMKK